MFVFHLLLLGNTMDAPQCRDVFVLDHYAPPHAGLGVAPGLTGHGEGLALAGVIMLAWSQTLTQSQLVTLTWILPMSGLFIVGGWSTTRE